MFLQLFSIILAAHLGVSLPVHHDEFFEDNPLTVILAEPEDFTPEKYDSEEDFEEWLKDHKDFLKTVNTKLFDNTYDFDDDSIDTAEIYSPEYPDPISDFDNDDLNRIDSFESKELDFDGSHNVYDFHVPKYTVDRDTLKYISDILNHANKFDYGSFNSYENPLYHSTNYDLSKEISNMDYDKIKADNEAHIHSPIPELFFAPNYEGPTSTGHQDHDSHEESIDDFGLDKILPDDFNSYDQFGPSFMDDYNRYPSYSFNYELSDPFTGDFKSQQEVKDGDVVRGTYSQMEPDGFIHVVEYEGDDKNGFNTVVKKITPSELHKK